MRKLEPDYLQGSGQRLRQLQKLILDQVGIHSQCPSHVICSLGEIENPVNTVHKAKAYQHHHNLPQREVS